jgi:diadenosine tetraphosphatase ApaH/serine/threonine PP2A family protein phosphatase
LGDIVGYGPNPCECIDLAMQCKICVLGNHDQGALFDPEGFSSGAEKAIFWTRDQLEKSNGNPEQNRKRWNFLCGLPRQFRENGLLLVHGSARNPLTEYVFPEDAFIVRKIEKIFALIDHVCFQGHTHVPGVFIENYQFLRPADIDGRFTLGSEKVMINVGSVGQPRDGDRRSCYVLQEDNALTFRRVEYPAEVTAEKIYAIDELDNFLGDRLLEGR